MTENTNRCYISEHMSKAIQCLSVSNGPRFCVSERLTGVEVLTPYGATADYPVEFRAMAIQSDGSADTDDVDIHYVWDFGETVSSAKNLL